MSSRKKMRLSNLLRLDFAPNPNRRSSTFYVDEPSKEGSTQEMDTECAQENSQPSILSTVGELGQSANDDISHEKNDIKMPYQIRHEDLFDLGQIGKDGFGIVHKMKELTTGRIMAVKRIRCTMDENEQKRIVDNDVQVHAKANSCPFVVTFYDVFFKEGDFWICMELMHTSLKQFYEFIVEKYQHLVKEEFLWKVAFSTINALLFLKEQLKIIHRDVKPGNILLNRQGEIKLCDFGAAGRLINSIAKTRDAGCQPYMAPERIAITANSAISINQSASDRLAYLDSIFNDTTFQGNEIASISIDEKIPAQFYDVRSDVWSLGITLVEVATGKYPYSKFRSIFDQINVVVNGPAPVLAPEIYSNDFSTEFIDFVDQCLKKEVSQRPTFKELLETPFIVKWSSRDLKVTEYIQEILDSMAAALH